MSAPRALVRAQIRELVAHLHAGDRLPGERELAARLGVARMTLRAAVDSLVSEGVLERRHGSGTFVVPTPVVRILGMTSFTEDMRSRGMVAASTLVSFAVEPASAEAAASLDIPVGAEIYHFTRLRSGDGEPMALETTWMPTQYAPRLRSTDLDGSLYRVLATRYRIVASSAQVRIDPVVPEPAERVLLGIDQAQACLRLRMIDSDHRGRVIMAALCLYRGDKYHLLADVPRASFGLGLRGAS